MVLVYDFGDVLKREKKAPNKSYYAKFGSTFFLSIFFSFIKYIIEHPWKINENQWKIKLTPWKLTEISWEITENP